MGGSLAKSVFRLVDEDGSGDIDVDEAKSLVKVLPEHLKAHVRDLVALTGDNPLTLKQFTDYFSKRGGSVKGTKTLLADVKRALEAHHEKESKKRIAIARKGTKQKAGRRNKRRPNTARIKQEKQAKREAQRRRDRVFREEQKRLEAEERERKQAAAAAKERRRRIEDANWHKKYEYPGHEGSREGNAMLLAAEKGDRLEVVRTVKEKESDVNYQAGKDWTLEKVGWSALLYAADRGHRGVATSVISQGGKIDARSEVGWSALMVAVYRGNQSMVKHLLELKADPNLKQTFIPPVPEEKDEATRLIEDFFVSDIREVAPDPPPKPVTPPPTPPAKRMARAREELGKLFADIYDEDNQLKAMHLIQKASKDPHTRYESLKLDDPMEGHRQGWTYLHAAVLHENVNLVRTLLDAKASPNVRSKTGNTPMHLASQHMDTEPGRDICKFLMEAGADVLTFNDVAQQTVLDVVQHPRDAVYLRTYERLGKYGRPPEIEYDKIATRFARKSPPKAGEPRNVTAAIIASWMGHESILKLLMKSRADLFAKDQDGKDSEDWADWEDRKDLVKLIQEGKIEQRRLEELERRRRLAMAKKFLEACEHGDIEEVREMLQDPRIETRYRYQSGYTVLMAASKGGHIEVVKALLEHDPDLLWIRDDGGGTAAMKAAAAGKTDVILEFAVIEQEQKVPAEESVLNAQDNDGWTALMLASMHGHMDTVTTLCQAGVDLDKVQSSGISAQQWAVIEEHWEVAKMLQYTREKRIKDAEDAKLARQRVQAAIADKFGGTMPDGLSAVMLAAMYGHADVVRRLVAVKADITLKDKGGMTAYDWAVKLKHKSAAGMLLAELRRLEAEDYEMRKKAARALAARMLSAVEYADVSKIKALLADPLHLVDFEHKGGRTALVQAAVYNHTHVIALLVEAHADVNHQMENGYSALMRASVNGRVATVRSLIDNKAIVNLQNKWGWAPITRASMRGHTEVVQVLIQAKARLDAQDEDDWSAIGAAAVNGHASTVELLVAARANLDLLQNQGKDAEAWADAKEQHLCADLLRRAKDAERKRVLREEKRMQRLTAACKRLVFRIARGAARIVDNRPAVRATKWAVKTAASRAVDIVEAKYTEFVRQWVRGRLDFAIDEAGDVAEEKRQVREMCGEVVWDLVEEVYMVADIMAQASDSDSDDGSEEDPGDEKHG